MRRAALFFHSWTLFLLSFPAPAHPLSGDLTLHPHTSPFPLNDTGSSTFPSSLFPLSAPFFALSTPTVPISFNMAATQTAVHRPRKLVSAWLFLSSFVVAWDVGYILLRPRSMLGGDLHWIWSPYALYMDIDYVYGLPSWDTKDGFPAAQSLMNVGESILNLFYIYLVHVKATPAALAIAPIFGLITVTMTLSKTILYVLNVSSVLS